MADEQYTPEDQATIAELLGALDQPPSSGIFDPMARQLKSDMAELRSPETTDDFGEGIAPDGEFAQQPAGSAFDESDTLPDSTGEFAFDSPASTSGPDDFATDFNKQAAQPDSISEDTGLVAPELPSGDDFELELDGPASSPANFDLGVDQPGSSGNDFDLGHGDSSGLDSGLSGASDFDLDLATDDMPGAEATPMAADDFGPGMEAADSPTDFDLGVDDSSGTAFDDFGLEAASSPADFDLGVDDSSGAASDDFGLEAASSPADFDSGADDFSSTPASDDFGPGLDAPADNATDFGLGLDDSSGADATPMDADDFGLGLDAPSGGDFSSSSRDGLDEPSGELAAAVDSSLPMGGGDDFAATDDFAVADDFSTSMQADDLQEMAEQARLNQGIGEEFSDEELANIRQSLLDYPPGIKKNVVDAIVNEKVSAPDQRMLMNMVADQAEPETIADFLEARLGYRPDVAPSDVRKDGVRIIYAEGQSPEELAARRRRAKIILAGAGAGLLAIIATFSTITFYRIFSTRSLYDSGLAELQLARDASPEKRLTHKEKGEKYFQEALASAGGEYDLEYLNKYGIAYMQAGYSDEAFVKLFGRVDPEYGAIKPELAWNIGGRRAPLIRLVDGSVWPEPDQWIYQEKQPVFTARDNIRRRLVIPGAYTVSRLRDDKLDHTTLINLGRFHSRTLTARDRGEFPPHTEGNICNLPADKPPGENPPADKYKNDALGIDYYRLILTLMNQPDDIPAIAGIGDVYYRNKEYGAAAREFNRILDKNPLEIAGQTGLLNTYIEIWKTEGDPRLVIARHRLLRKLDLEDELPLYTLTKLASFYIDLEADDLRIRYQIDPVDAMSGMDLKDNAIYLIESIFLKEEERDGETLTGSAYGEGFYQRGRYLMKKGEATRALKQFENAFKYDHRHYLAVNAIGEHYKKIHDYEKASEYFVEARRIYDRYSSNYGLRPEDETLIGGDHALIFYNLGSLLYRKNAGVPEGAEGFSGSRIYPDRSQRIETPEMVARRQSLRQASQCFRASMEHNIKDHRAEANMRYWLGWIDYTSADFENALLYWEEMDPNYAYHDSTLIAGMANAYYYSGQPRSAIGNYLKLVRDFEERAQAIPNPDPDDESHRYVFLTLASVLNNLGAAYEKELYAGALPSSQIDLRTESLTLYWKAIEAARRVNQDNEIARTNVQLAFKTEKREPLLDDWIPPVLENEHR